MKRIYFGLMILGALMLLPLSGAVVNGWNDIHPLERALVPFLKIVSALLVGAAVAHSFIVMSALKSRLATRPPGANVMLAGLLIFVGLPSFLALLLSLRMMPEFPRFFAEYGLTNYPATIVLLVGAFRVLMHLEPRIKADVPAMRAQTQQ